MTDAALLVAGAAGSLSHKQHHTIPVREGEITGTSDYGLKVFDLLKIFHYILVNVIVKWSYIAVMVPPVKELLNKVIAYYSFINY